MENPINEEFLRNCHAHATAKNGEIIHLYVNPLGRYDDKEKVEKLREELRYWAKDTYDFPSIQKDQEFRQLFPTEEQEQVLQAFSEFIADNPDSGYTIRF